MKLQSKQRQLKETFEIMVFSVCPVAFSHRSFFRCGCLFFLNFWPFKRRLKYMEVLISMATAMLIITYHFDAFLFCAHFFYLSFGFAFQPFSFQNLGTWLSSFFFFFFFSPLATMDWWNLTICVKTNKKRIITNAALVWAQTVKF